MVENTIPQDFDAQINDASPIVHLNDQDFLQTELITTTNSKKLQPQLLTYQDSQQRKQSSEHRQMAETRLPTVQIPQETSQISIPEEMTR